MYIPSRTHRTLIMGSRRRGRRQSSVADAAGLDVLRAGGNALDAAVAISLSLGVVEPMMSGLGGDGFYQVHERENADTLLERDRRGAVRRHAGTVSHVRASRCADRWSVSTPGMLGGIAAMHAALGIAPWRDLCRAGHRTGARGFCGVAALPAFRRRWSRRAGGRPAQPRGVSGRAGDPAFRRWPPSFASPIWRARWRKSPRAAPNTFYRGKLAQRLVAGHARRPASWSTSATSPHASPRYRSRSGSVIAAFRSARRRRIPPASPCCKS